MALTVEELQIKLGCDATEAQEILKKMDDTVKAYTEKFQKYFQTKTGKAAPLDNVAKQIDNTAKKVESGVKRIKKAYKDMSEPPYVPSGNKYVGGDKNGRGGGMGDPNYFRNSEAFKMTFGNRKPNGELVEYGAQLRAIIEDSLGSVDSLSKAMKLKIGDALTKLRDLSKQYQDAVREHGANSPQASSAESKFKAAIYAADKYAQQLAKVAAKEQEVAAKESGVVVETQSRWQKFMASVKSGASAVRFSFRSVGSAIKRAFNHSLLGRFINRLRMVTMRMAAMKLIRGTIQGVQQGLQELAKTSTSSAKAMNTIQAAGGSIKMALGAAVMPIVKALAPLFVRLAGAVSAACNAIAQFFAVITGQGTYTAVNFSSALDSVSSSAGGAGKAVKGALAAFDELVVIGNQSGGGGGGGSGVGQSLSTVADLPAVSELATRIRESILSGNWEGVGRALNDCLATLTVKFNNWLDRVRELELGRKAAEIVNGFFAPNEEGEYTTFEEAGKSVGKALGVIIHDINVFFTTVNWDDVGQSIRAFVRGLNTEIDNVFKEEFGPGAYWEPFFDGISEDFERMWEDTKTSFNEAKTFFAQGWSDIGSDFINIGTIINASLGIAGEYVSAFFVTLIDYIGARGEIISGNVSRFILNIKASVLEGLAGLVDNLSNGPMGRLLQLIGVDLGNAAQSLRDKAAQARDNIAEIDTKIADAQQRAANGFDINANVNTSKITDLNNKINDAKSAINNTASAVGTLGSKINNLPSNKTTTITVKVNTKGGSSSSSSGVNVNRPNISVNLAMASGGIAYGLTPAIIGEYAGAKSNPEVVAPLSDLLGILNKANVGGGDGKVSADQIRLLEEQNRLLRVIAKKELKLSPSAELGQVVSRSSQLYART